METNVAKRQRLSVRGVRSLRRKLLPVLIAGCVGSALANPLGPQVVNGQASFSQQGNTLSITNTPGAVINWQAFSIGSGEVTRFIQQSASSSVLNRVVGQDPSQILGALQSNGRVFLVNPNGILFGAGAQINVNGLIASTLDISNEDFLNGKMRFKTAGTVGNLKNEGTITTPDGGHVYLIAPNVENSGIITSPRGEVLLAAGHSVELVDSANPDLHVVLSAAGNEALNVGEIVTQGGKTGIFGDLVRHSGIVNANSAVVGENGKIVFKASGDTLLENGSRTTATGAGKGGEIQLLGERVGLTGDAIVDASGQQGGGSILIGGDYQGANPDIQNAKYTYSGRDVAIKADAIETGDGGKVILWADDTTKVYSTISAKGGATSGDGGFVETSGKVNLDFDAKVDTRAANGNTGTVLLDPTTLNIVNGGGALNDDYVSGDSTINFADSPGIGFSVSELALEGLSANTNVVLEASGTITLEDLADNALTFAQGTGNSVTMHSSTGSIIGMDVNDRILTNGASVNLTADNGDINIGGVRSFGGNVNMNAGGGIAVREIVTSPSTAGAGGDITLQAGGSLTLGSNAPTGGETIDAGTGSVSLMADTGSISGSAQVRGNHLYAMALNGIDLFTAVAGLSADNAGSGSDITIRNTGPLSLFSVRQSGMESTGNITIENTGALIVGMESQIVARRGAISLTAFSPLTIEEYASVRTDATTPGEGNITLWAHGSTVPTGVDILTIKGSVSTVAGNITLRAGDAIDGASNAVSSGGGTVTTLAQMNSMSPPSLPSPPSSAMSPQDQASNAILTTIALINEVQNPVLPESSFAALSEGGGEQVPDSDDSVPEEKDVAAEKNAGVKENETAKKLYCN